MDPDDIMKIRAIDFDKLVNLAWCGINDGAGRDEDMEKILRRLEKLNPPYHEERKAERMARHEETRRRRKEAKAFAREHCNEVMWYHPTGDGLTRTKVQVLEHKDVLIRVKFINGKVEHHPDCPVRDLDFWSREKRSVWPKSLKPLGEQFGPVTKVKKVGVYVPGTGIAERGAPDKY